MDRRELLKKSVLIAGGACATRLLAQNTNPSYFCTDSVTGRKGLGVSPACSTGPSCVDMGMVGKWPNCYYPQYLNLNRTLAGQVHSAFVQLAIATKARTVTQAMVSQIQSVLPAYVNHLLATTINEGLRQQYVGGLVYTAPTQTYADVATSWATANGVDPNAAEEAYWASSPNLAASTASVPTLQQQILALPLSPGTWDNINALINADVMSVQSPSVGTLICNALGGGTQLQTDGSMLMAVGTLIDKSGIEAGPAAP